MKYNDTNKPLQCIMSQSTCYMSTTTMDILGVLWHSTGANNTSLKRYVQPDDDAKDRKELLTLIGSNPNKNDYNHSKKSAGLNAFIGKLADGTVTSVQTMPWNYRPWGCGSGSNGSCNSGWIQFEICEDALTSKQYFEAVYKEACELTAYLCKKYNIDPNGTVKVNGVSVPTVLCHADSNKYGMGSNHADVNHWFSKFGKTMNDVRKDVAALMKEPVPVQPTTQASSAQVSTLKAIKVGDLVKIVGNKYYSGKDIPSWVKAKNWYVKSVSGDRVVIDKSEDGVNSISSPVNEKDLMRVPGKEIVYSVVRGDTLSRIAAKYGVTVADIVAYNGIENPNKIAIAQKIIIPTEYVSAPVLQKKSIDEIAKEVINGEWGRNEERKKLLTEAGYNYEEVQARVNQILK